MPVQYRWEKKKTISDESQQTSSLKWDTWQFLKLESNKCRWKCATCKLQQIRLQEKQSSSHMTESHIHFCDVGFVARQHHIYCTVVIYHTHNALTQRQEPFTCYGFTVLCMFSLLKHYCRATLRTLQPFLFFTNVLQTHHMQEIIKIPLQTKIKLEMKLD